MRKILYNSNQLPKHLILDSGTVVISKGVNPIKEIDKISDEFQALYIVYPDSTVTKKDIIQLFSYTDKFEVIILVAKLRQNNMKLTEIVGLEDYYEPKVIYNIKYPEQIEFMKNDMASNNDDCILNTLCEVSLNSLEDFKNRIHI